MELRGWRGVAVYLNERKGVLVVSNSLHRAASTQPGKPVEGIEDRNARLVMKQLKDSKPGCVKDPRHYAPGNAWRSRSKKVPAPLADGSSRHPLECISPRLKLKSACPRPSWTLCSSASPGGVSRRKRGFDCPFHGAPSHGLHMGPR